MTHISGARALLLEDDPVLAFTMELALNDLGIDVIGPAYSISEAKTLALSSKPDVALLDVHIKGERCYDLAMDLVNRIPLIFVSGSSNEVRRLFPEAFVLEKPLNKKKLLAALVSCLSR